MAGGFPGYHRPMPRKTPTEALDIPRVRLDKWLWAARFYKTRALARAAIEGGRVRCAPGTSLRSEPPPEGAKSFLGRPGERLERLEGDRVKPSRELWVGDLLTLHINDLEWVVCVLKLSERRGPAVAARQLYAETEASLAARLQAVEQRRLAVEPGTSIRGRPSKKNLRLIHRFTDSG